MMNHIVFKDPKRCSEPPGLVRSGPGQVEVVMGHGEVSGIKTLTSFGFSTCSAFLVINDKTSEVLLLHVDQLPPPFNRNEKVLKGPIKEERLDPYLKYAEQIRATTTLIPITSDLSYDRTSMVSNTVGDRFHNIAEVVDIDTNEGFWSVAYMPLEGRLYIRINNMYYVTVEVQTPGLPSSVDGIIPLAEQIQKAETSSGCHRPGVDATQRSASSEKRPSWHFI